MVLVASHSLRSRPCCYVCFTEEQTEEQRNVLTPGDTLRKGWNLDPNPGSLGPEALLLTTTQAVSLSQARVVAQ